MRLSDSKIRGLHIRGAFLAQHDVFSRWGPLGSSWRHIGRSWRHIGPSWPHLRATLAHLGATLAHLGATLAHLGATLANLGATLAHLGVTLAHLGATLAHLGATFASKRRRLRHFRPTSQQRRQRYRAFCVRAASLSAAVVRSTMNNLIIYYYTNILRY